MAAAAGQVDILVDDAGIPVSGFSMLPFAEEDPSRWKAFIDLNVYGPLNCTHAVLPGMIARGWGRVITISSESARVGDKRLSVYAASKGAGPAFMRSLAKEVGRNGITCNTLSLATQNNARLDEASDMRLRQLEGLLHPPPRHRQRRRRRDRMARLRQRILGHRADHPRQRRLRLQLTSELGNAITLHGCDRPGGVVLLHLLSSTRRSIFHPSGSRLNASS